MNKFLVKGLIRQSLAYLQPRSEIFSRTLLLERAALADYFTKALDVVVCVYKVQEDDSRVEIGYTLSEEVDDLPVGGRLIIEVEFTFITKHVLIERMYDDDYIVVIKDGD